MTQTEITALRDVVTTQRRLGYNYDDGCCSCAQDAAAEAYDAAVRSVCDALDDELRRLETQLLQRELAQ